MSAFLAAMQLMTSDDFVAASARSAKGTCPPWADCVEKVVIFGVAR